MKRMLDLFCGRFGWSRAFAARGWECVGVDLVEPANLDELQCEFGEYGVDTGRLGFQRSDVMNLFWDGGALWDRERGVCVCHGPDFICASSPCDGFASFGMKHFRPNPPYPSKEIQLFNQTRSLCEESGLPYVMENVRDAQQFIGPAFNHCGPFYLWGNAVPPLMSQGISKAKWYRRPGKPGNFADELNLPKAERKAKLSMIPIELANCVADYAERLLETSHEQTTGVSGRLTR